MEVPSPSQLTIYPGPELPLSLRPRLTPLLQQAHLSPTIFLWEEDPGALRQLPSQDASVVPLLLWGREFSRAILMVSINLFLWTFFNHSLPCVSTPSLVTAFDHCDASRSQYSHGHTASTRTDTRHLCSLYRCRGLSHCVSKVRYSPTTIDINHILHNNSWASTKTLSTPRYPLLRVCRFFSLYSFSLFTPSVMFKSVSHGCCIGSESTCKTYDSAS